MKELDEAANSFIQNYQNLSVLSFITEDVLLNEDEFERKCHLAYRIPHEEARIDSCIECFLKGILPHKEFEIMPRHRLSFKVNYEEKYTILIYQLCICQKF